MLLSTKFGDTLLFSNRLLRQPSFYFFFFFFFSFFYFSALHLGCCTGFFLAARSKGYCFVLELRLLLAVASLVEHKLWGSLASVVAAQVLSSCSSQALEPGLRSCGAWGLVAPRHVESSQTRDVPCTARQILYTREVLFHFFSERTR